MGNIKIFYNGKMRDESFIKRQKECEKERKIFYENLKYKSNKYNVVNKYLREKNICYVYFLFYFKELVYIGKSINPDARMLSHGFKYNLIRKIKTSQSLADKWEMKLIKKYQPKHNKSGIKYFKVIHSDKKGSYTIYSDRIKYKDIKKNIKLNLKFKKEIKTNEIYLGKDSRNLYLSLKEFLKKYPSKFYYKKGSRIIFFNYKPKEINYLDAQLIPKDFNISHLQRIHQLNR